MHSHYGVDPAPGLKGTDDTNSLKAPILPWLRSLDGINTHDLAFNLSIAGGITTSMVLPGSAGNILVGSLDARTLADNTEVDKLLPSSPVGLPKILLNRCR
jgi:imidazolonepropionase-like amidohydrolase